MNDDHDGAVLEEQHRQELAVEAEAYADATTGGDGESLATDAEMWEGIQGPHAFERADYDEVRGEP